MNITQKIEAKIRESISKQLKEARFVSNGDMIDNKCISNVSLIDPFDDDESNNIYFKGTCEYMTIGEASGRRRFEGRAVLKEVHVVGRDIELEIEFPENVLLKNK